MTNTSVNPGETKEVVKQPTASSVENNKGIENHKSAAIHHQEAAKHHLEAINHHEKGNHEKAAQSTIRANGHSSLANDHQKEDAKHHAING
jgi:hypothetical protein